MPPPEIVTVPFLALVLVFGEADIVIEPLPDPLAGVTDSHDRSSDIDQSAFELRVTVALPPTGGIETEEGLTLMIGADPDWITSTLLLTPSPERVMVPALPFAEGFGEMVTSIGPPLVPPAGISIQSGEFVEAVQGILAVTLMTSVPPSGATINLVGFT